MTTNMSSFPEDVTLAVSKAAGQIAFLDQTYGLGLWPTGTEALRLIETEKYAVIMTDMRMPDVDGPSLYRQVSARDSLLAKSFLFITGDPFREETRRFLTDTSAVYLSKPCSFAEVESAVGSV